MSLEINPQDVIKLMLQFLKENGLLKSFRALQAESEVTLNSVDSVDVLHNDIIHGRWDVVLKVIPNLRLPLPKLMDLFEQIILELMEVAEFETASLILRESFTQNGLRKEFPERTMRLDHMVQRGHFDPKEAYPDGVPKDKRRQFIADDIISEISIVPSGRLLSLLGQLLKYQVKEGTIPPNIKYDLFTGKIPEIEDDEEMIPAKLERTLKFGAEACIEIAKFSPNGSYLVTGSIDGIIEVLEPSTGKLRTDLTYQADEKFMLHTETVVSLGFSKDSELMASGSKNGQVKVWRLQNGSCLRKYDSAHDGSISSLMFGKDITQVISASKEIKIWGLKSGKKLKEFAGHDLAVTDMMLTSDGNKLLSCARDGAIKVWDFKSTECILVFKPPSIRPGHESDIYQLMPFPYVDKEGNPENFMVCSRSHMIHLMNTNGQTVRAYENDKKGVLFEAAGLSSQGSLMYGLTEKGFICCFETETGKLVREFPIATKNVSSMAHHPLRNIIVISTMDGNVLFYRA